MFKACSQQCLEFQIRSMINKQSTLSNTKCSMKDSVDSCKFIQYTKLSNTKYEWSEQLLKERTYALMNIMQNKNNFQNNGIMKHFLVLNEITGIEMYEYVHLGI